MPAPPVEREDVRHADIRATRHWLGFYADLIAFEERVLDSMYTLAENLTPEIRDRVQQSNLTPMRREVKQLRDRRAVWERRRRELET